MRYTSRRRAITGHRRFVLFGAAFGLVIIGLVVALMLTRQVSHDKSPVSKKAVDITSKSVSTTDSVSSRIQFVGDVFWGRYMQRKAERSSLGTSYFTSKLTQSDRAKYDAWIGNFECPITSRDVPYDQQVAHLRFNCRPEYLPEFAKWFTAGGLANNHTMNNGGQWGIDQTRANLQKSGIQYFGNYDMNQLDDICEVIAMPARSADGKAAKIPVALCGYMQVVNVAPTEAQLQVMQKYARVMPVIAMPHMGVEYRTTAEPEKISAYHRMIDNGADAVIAAHPHVIQNSESYKGRLIAYSLGNFLFDQQSLGRDTTVGLAVDITLTIDDSHAVGVYTDIAPSCAKYRDDCLARLSQDLPRRPGIRIEYGFGCYDQSNTVGGLPTLGSGSVCDAAKQRATVDKLTGLDQSW